MDTNVHSQLLKVPYFEWYAARGNYAAYLAAKLAAPAEEEVY